MRALIKRIKFALTPKSKRRYSLQLWGSGRDSFFTLLSGEQKYVELRAFRASRLGVKHRVIRIK